MSYPNDRTRRRIVATKTRTGERVEGTCWDDGLQALYAVHVDGSDEVRYVSGPIDTIHVFESIDDDDARPAATVAVTAQALRDIDALLIDVLTTNERAVIKDIVDAASAAARVAAENPTDVPAATYVAGLRTALAITIRALLDDRPTTASAVLATASVVTS